jgi:hypothetical protein
MRDNRVGNGVEAVGNARTRLFEFVTQRLDGPEGGGRISEAELAKGEGEAVGRADQRLGNIHGRAIIIGHGRILSKDGEYELLRGNPLRIQLLIDARRHTLCVVFREIPP